MEEDSDVVPFEIAELTDEPTGSEQSLRVSQRRLTDLSREVRESVRATAFGWPVAVFVVAVAVVAMSGLFFFVIGPLQAQVQSQNRQIKALKSDYGQTEAALEAMRTEKEALQQSHEVMVQEVEKSVAERDKLRKRAEALEAELAREKDSARRVKKKPKKRPRRRR